MTISQTVLRRVYLYSSWIAHASCFIDVVTTMTKSLQREAGDRTSGGYILDNDIGFMMGEYIGKYQPDEAKSSAWWRGTWIRKAFSCYSMASHLRNIQSVTFDITVCARVLLLRCNMSEVCLAELSVWYSGDGEWRVAQGGGLNTEEQHLIEKNLSQSSSKEMQNPGGWNPRQLDHGS